MSAPVREDLRARFETLIQTLDSAATKLDHGKPINLKNFENQVSILCADVIKAGPDAAHDIKPLMGEMITRLDELAERLRAFSGARE